MCLQKQTKNDLKIERHKNIAILTNSNCFSSSIILVIIYYINCIEHIKYKFTSINMTILFNNKNI